MYTILLAIIGIACGWFLQFWVLLLITVVFLGYIFLTFRFENGHYPPWLIDIISKEKFYKFWLMLILMWSAYFVALYRSPLLEFLQVHVLR
jgi:hypothetical protein